MTTPPTTRLTLTAAGLPSFGRILLIVLVPVVVLMVLPLGPIIASAFSRFGGAMSVAGPLFIGLLLLGLLVALVWGLLRVFRAGAHLEGTELTVRPGAFSTHRVDLASARQLRLAAESSGMSAVSTLFAGMDAQGRSAKVAFGRARNGYLPLHEVEALVAAIRTGARQGVEAQQAEHAIQELYLRAAAPGA
ncbi:MAG: hypothetical protein GEV10_07925 [Streptosporangiales bacterium]|nr:hypothetical protein [Streptosporangiales bacterium]